ncbi:MAG: HIT family protein [bacterium]|nr:HIT family protein [bacterium]
MQEDSKKCRICLPIQGIENDELWLKQSDIFYRDEAVVGFVSAKFTSGNEGNVIIVPVNHVETLYDLDEETGARIISVSRKVAKAMKETYKCDGITVNQNNDAAGDQHVFHYHMHLFPRYEGDDFQVQVWKTEKVEPEARAPFADKLRAYLENN